MYTIVMRALFVACVTSVAWAQPSEWSDDFTTVATYDSASLLAPCYGGSPTKYTIIEAVISDLFNERALSGGGKFIFTNRTGVVTPPILPGRVDVAVLGWLGVGAGCPGEPPTLVTDHEFTNDDLCMYGGILFNAWQLDVPIGTFDNNGPDGQPGVAGVDDDLDGTIDELDEALASRPTPVNGGYGNRDGTGFQAGLDAAPGSLGVDDDGNGTIDDIGETGWPGTDDGDDQVRDLWWFTLNSDFARSESIFVEIDLSGLGGMFAIREARDLADILVEKNNEISTGFYAPHTHYNWVFCASGTCHGAILWTGRDMANPDETLGPVLNTHHTGPTANQVALGFIKNSASDQYLRYMHVLGNGNFSERFWVTSGNPANADFTSGIFGYPSPSSDLDGDRDVDGTDFLTFSNCFNGSLNPPQGLCANLDADLDGDEDVDGTDFLTFSNCFNGALKRPNALCFPPDLTACQ